MDNVVELKPATKLYKKYTSLLDGDILTESEIISLKSRISHNPFSLTNHEVSSLRERFWDCEYKITPEHAQKGIDYLRLKCLKLNGKPRKTKQVENMPTEFFDAIQEYSHFTFVGFEELDYNLYSNRSSYMPIWRIHTKSGSTFDYCMNIDLSFQEL